MFTVLLLAMAQIELIWTQSDTFCTLHVGMYNTATLGHVSAEAHASCGSSRKNIMTGQYSESKNISNSLCRLTRSSAKQLLTCIIQVTICDIFLWCRFYIISFHLCVRVLYPFLEWCAAEDCFGPSNRWPVGYQNTLPGVTTCQTLQSPDAGTGSCMWIRHLYIISTQKKGCMLIELQLNYKTVDFLLSLFCLLITPSGLNITHLALRTCRNLQFLSFERPSNHVIRNETSRWIVAKIIICCSRNA